LARRKGLFISLEGPDGAGKSTQARLLALELRRLGKTVLLTREPGGSPQAAKIRKLVLGAKGYLSPHAELLLFLADRAQHVKDTIEAALKKGQIVICDRFGDSTVAYQGGGRGFGILRLEALNRFASGGLSPDLTLLFDLKPGQGLSRARRRGAADRMEKAGREFHRRVRMAFLSLAKRHPRRIKLIRVAGRATGEIKNEAMAYIRRHL
jgi:dTMP kinase